MRNKNLSERFYQIQDDTLKDIQSSLIIGDSFKIKDIQDDNISNIRKSVLSLEDHKWVVLLL